MADKTEPTSGELAASALTPQDLARAWEIEADEIDVGPEEDTIVSAVAGALRECAADLRRVLGFGG